MGQLFSSTPKDEDHGDLESSFGEYFKNYKAESKIIPQKTIHLIELHLQKGNIRGVNSVVSDALKNVDNAPINVAVTGKTGVGKSSFINALRGVGPEEEGAAEIGILSTTMKITPYKHPKIKTLTLWDLPGLGTWRFPPRDYLEKMKFQEYDFVIIVSAMRITKLELDLIKALKFMGKNYCFVKTKVDSDLECERRYRPHTFNREKTLSKIRSYCLHVFRDNGIGEPQVFLISNCNSSDYDFPILVDFLVKELPAQKHHDFMLSLSNTMDAAIERKHESMRLEAFKAGRLATVNVVGILRGSDVEKLKKSLNHYRVLFGVDDVSLELVAKDAQVPVEQLKKKLKSPYLLETKKNEALGEKLLKHLEIFAPANGGLLATGLYFRKSFYLQLYFLDTVTEDAKVLLQLPFLNTTKGQFSSATPNPEDNTDLESCFTEYFKKIKIENKIIPQDTIHSIELLLQKGNIHEANSVIRDALAKINNASINVAVTGESGAGKSSFINALRGVGPEEEGAAETGTVETTMKRTSYKHPKIKTLTLWDLPGIGTMKFPPRDYLEEVQFQEYDFFIIVSATRITKLELDLAKAVRMMNKNYCFVRTKVDLDLENEKKSKPRTFDREERLSQIRSYCEKTFSNNKMDRPPIFLISNHSLSEYDFPDLMDTLNRDLPVLKRHNFILAMPNITETVIQRKYSSLHQLIWVEAFKSGVLMTPVDNILLYSDVANLKMTLNRYRDLFGVDDKSLELMAKDFQVPVEQLKKKLKSPYVLEMEEEETLEEKLLKYLENFSSATGGVLGTGRYFRKIFYLHFHFLDTVAEDAKVLLREAYSKS